jgi:hypothetical protein
MGHARVQVEKQALEVLLEITKQNFLVSYALGEALNQSLKMIGKYLA